MIQGSRGLETDSMLKQRIMVLVPLLLALPFLLVNLDSWPPTWFDEGVFLHGAKNVALHGEYATLSGGRFTRFDPYFVGAGPTMLIPAAVLFRLADIGLVQGRMVSVVYAVVCIWLCYGLASHMMDIRAAVVASAVMIWAPWGDFVQAGRFAMGEMASLTFVLAGLCLWWRSVDRDSIWWSVTAGVAFGLALLSKPQNIFVVAALLLVGIVDALYYRRLGIRRWGLPLLIAVSFLLVWQGFQAAVIGLPEWLYRLQTSETASRALATIYRPRRLLANANNLVKSGYPVWAVPAIAYFGFLTVRLKRESSKELLLLATIVLWLAWYVLGSVGWVRYAFVPMSLTSILLGRLFSDLTNGFRFDLGEIGKALRGTSATVVLGQLSLALLPLGLVASGMLGDATAILREGDQSAQRMADHLDTSVEPGALIETWEWEVTLLSNQGFHLPPSDVLEAMVRHMQLGAALPPLLYDLEEHQPEYLIDGPFSKWTELYTQGIDAGCCTLVHTSGPYDLYELGAREPGE